MAHLDTSKLFQDKADIYALARPHYPDALFDFVASLAEARSNAWDCATGNGQAALGLAKYFELIEATDISDNQIANAFPHERVRYSIQPAECTNFRDKSFDLVNVAQALHWFDLEKFWTEIERVLKPGGTFVASTYDWPYVTPEIDQAVETYVKAPIKTYWAPNNQLCWNGYRTIDFPFDPIPTPHFEILNSWNVQQFVTYLHTWSAVRRCIDKEGPGFFEIAETKIRAAWDNSETAREVQMPLHVVVGRFGKI